MKTFCSLKDSVSRMKRPATDWKEVIANHIPNKGLLIRIYKELLKFNSKKASNPVTNAQKT